VKRIARRTPAAATAASEPATAARAQPRRRSAGGVKTPPICTTSGSRALNPENATGVPSRSSSHPEPIACMRSMSVRDSDRSASFSVAPRISTE